NSGWPTHRGASRAPMPAKKSEDRRRRTEDGGQRTEDREESPVYSVLCPLTADIRRPECANMTATVTDPRAWRADTIDRPQSWYYPLSEATLVALDRDLRAWRRDSQPATELKASDALRSA